MKTHARVKFREYCFIRRRLQENMPIMTICALRNRSPRVIDMIRDSANFQDYKRIRSERAKLVNDKYRPKGGENMKEATFTGVTQKDFDLVKTLLGAGISRVKTAQLSKRSYFTVSWLGRSESLADYKAKIQAYSNRAKEQETLKAVGVNLDKYAKATSNEMPKEESKNETLEVLRSINRNLERLADAWEAHPAEKPLMKRLFSNS